MINRQKIIKSFDRAVEKSAARREYPARLGNAGGELYSYNDDGTVQVGYAWAIIDFGDDNGLTERVVRCRKVMPQIGLYVWIGYGRDGTLEVKEEDAEFAQNFGNGIGFNSAPHGWAHGIFGPDTIMIDGRQIVPLQTRPTNPPSLSVYVEPFSYIYEGTEKYWPGGETDLTSYVPTGAGEHTLLVTTLDPVTNTIEIFEGATEVPFVSSIYTIQFDGDDVALVDVGINWRSAALRIRAESTSLDWRDIFMDLRGGDRGNSGTTTPPALDDLTDVVITGAAQGDILIRNATQWVNQNIGVEEIPVRLTGGDVDGLSVPASTFVGRKATGSITALTVAETKTLLAVDHGADLAGLLDDDHTQYVIKTPTTATRNLITAATTSAHGLSLKTSDNNTTNKLFTVLTSGDVEMVGIDAVGQVLLTAPGATRIPLTIRAAASQTGDLTEWLTSAGAVRTSIAAGGALVFNAASADPTAAAIYRLTSGTSGLYVSNKSSPSGEVILETGSTGTLLWRFAKSGLNVGSPSGLGFIAVRTTNPATLTAAIRGEVSSGSSSGFVYGVAGFVTGAGGIDKAALHAEVESGAAGTNTYGLYVAPVGGGTARYAILTKDSLVVFNEDGSSGGDLRVEGDTDANLLFTDASADTVQVGAATTADSAKFYVSGKISASGEVEINGDLNHDGTNVGFFGTAPAAQSTGWAMSNVTPDKVLDANATSLDEVADVLGTLIDYLKTLGLLGA